MANTKSLVNQAETKLVQQLANIAKDLKRKDILHDASENLTEAYLIDISRELRNLHHTASVCKYIHLHIKPTNQTSLYNNAKWHVRP